jgi:predicted metalloprotease with PDZ domain
MSLVAYRRWARLLPKAIVPVFLLVLGTSAAAQQRQVITLRVDTRDVGRKLVHSEMEIPVTPGNLTLVFPKWIPGEHTPSGPLNNVVRMKFSAGSQSISWTRDPSDMFAFHLQVPHGAQKLDVALDYALRPDEATPFLFYLFWNAVLLYPKGVNSDDISIQGEIRLPSGWKYACAMSGKALADGTIQFPVTSLTTLVDSPLLAGVHFRTFTLDNGAIPVTIGAADDSEEGLNLSLPLLENFKRMIRETDVLFGARHYEHYVFLLALSDDVGEEDGTEHHQSTDITLRERGFIDQSDRIASLYLLPHEYVHSWNGKYRRPADLYTMNYQDPMKGSLLWVYEGLTRYLNWVLAARSGLFTLEQARDYAAAIAAEMEHRSGREWRSLEDTAVSVQLLYGGAAWESLRRTTDYYDESLLIWLEVDQIIRSKTSGQKSLDDFCRTFFGPPGGPPAVKPYTLKDLVNALNAIAAYDWADFIKRRVYEIHTAPLEGLTSSGWNLTYRDAPGPVLAARDIDHHTMEERYSIGLLLHSDDGIIVDVVRDSPAWKAGLGPGMKVLAVNGRTWSSQNLRDAIAADRETSAPMEMIVQSQSAILRTAIDDHRGLQYPRLERNSAPDTLSELLKPRAAH